MPVSGDTAAAWAVDTSVALVGEAARVHGLTLLTRDRRAVRTYDLLGVHYEMVGP